MYNVCTTQRNKGFLIWVVPQCPTVVHSSGHQLRERFLLTFAPSWSNGIKCADHWLSCQTRLVPSRGPLRRHVTVAVWRGVWYLHVGCDYEQSGESDIAILHLVNVQGANWDLNWVNRLRINILHKINLESVNSGNKSMNTSTHTFSFSVHEYLVLGQHNKG